jgi:hypothetical protein
MVCRCNPGSDRDVRAAEVAELRGGLSASPARFAKRSRIAEIERKVLRFGSKQKMHAICKAYVRAKGDLRSPQMNLAVSPFEATE